ncbi:hypothetical protein AVEN_10679-1 [Araneus ventricosus]|uniref:Uncharacterized protein n=1 Tax=Araneus ventricosus TaxID=182803 RepID=A0A4Y2EV10_ARAVE|nr:hypothetical protein AVEN_10679-1 [Araneus ventricosus]
MKKKPLNIISRCRSPFVGNVLFRFHPVILSSLTSRRSPVCPAFFYPGLLRRFCRGAAGGAALLTEAPAASSVSSASGNGHLLDQTINGQRPFLPYLRGGCSLVAESRLYWRPWWPSDKVPASGPRVPGSKPGFTGDPSCIGPVSR